MRVNPIFNFSATAKNSVANHHVEYCTAKTVSGKEGTKTALSIIATTTTTTTTTAAPNNYKLPRSSTFPYVLLEYENGGLVSCC